MESIGTNVTKHTTRVVSALTARTQLGAIMQRARDNQERFIVDRRGEPQVVILSVEDYFRNVVKEPQSLARLQAEARQRGLDKFPMSAIDREIRRIRKVRQRGV
ncbi:MAG: type II toxin-antitoxin system Phd/YefM family antitoxin [bacterium]|uniref:Antitoxin n=1 Tax=Candidatus Methylomirabilis tolerans TaxID=3123416 RepID=A0AAJ1EIU9_9BACT|nr:type II toxin-antitoxin system Phd/YefM family antitoxin [Candidatus Methylomirabilis sp.]